MMEKKLRRKFIFVSMCSLMTVLLLLIAGINLFNYKVQLRSLDNILDMIFENGGRLPAPPLNKDHPPQKYARPMSPEASFTIRYFVVHINNEGDIQRVDMDFIASVSEEEARDYVLSVINTGKTSGFYGDYRFRIYQGNNETICIFLNSSSEIQGIKTLALTSVFIAAIISLAVLILSYPTSRLAIRPFMKNTELQKQFITDAGHELKTPLTSISTSADVLSLTQGDNEWIINIKKQSVRLSNLVEELVDLSRMDENNNMYETKEFSLSDAIWEITEAFLAISRSAGKTFNQHIEDNLIYCGNQSDIQNMLSILLDNAVKYSDDGGSIELNARKVKRNIIIEIFNSCDQIDPQKLDRIFDRFYRSEESRSRNTGGSGIGLAIAKAIVEAHKGNITAYSHDGKSICIRVVL